MKSKTESKRKAPDMTGVPGELVCDLDPTLQWGKKKVSPYDTLLDQLSAATDAAIAADRAFPKLPSALPADIDLPALSVVSAPPFAVMRPLPGPRFPHRKAKASIWARAKKKGFKVLFAEPGDGSLFVRIDGRVNALERRGESIRSLLRIGPATTMVITSKLRANGDETCDAQGVDAMLAGMAKRGEVVRQEGAAWKLMPKRAA